MILQPLKLNKYNEGGPAKSYLTHITGTVGGPDSYHKTIPFDLTNTILDPQGRFGVSQGRSPSLVLVIWLVYMVLMRTIQIFLKTFS